MIRANLIYIPLHVFDILMEFLQNALLSAIPFLANWLFSIGYSHVLDLLVSRKIIKTVNARKTSMAIGNQYLGSIELFFYGIALH